MASLFLQLAHQQAGLHWHLLRFLYKVLRVRLPIKSRFVIDLILPATLRPRFRLGLQQMYQGYLLGGKCGRCVALTTLPPSLAGCLEILGATTFWGPQGLSRSVKGLISLYPSR
jgi:hypothetical protein